MNKIKFHVTIFDLNFCFKTNSGFKQLKNIYKIKTGLNRPFSVPFFKKKFKIFNQRIVYLLNGANSSLCIGFRVYTTFSLMPKVLPY